jgi:hypothetical protein
MDRDDLLELDPDGLAQFTDAFKSIGSPWARTRPSSV